MDFTVLLGVGMDSDQQVYVLLSVLGRKYLFSIWQQNISLKNSVPGEATGTETILFPSSIIFPAYWVKRLSSHIYERQNKPDVWNFNLFHSRAQLESGNKLPPEILSTMIFDSLESVRLRKQKTPLQNVLLEHTTQYSQVKPLINVDNIWYQLILSW